MATIKQRYAPHSNNYKYLIHPLKESRKIKEGFLYTEEQRNIHNHYFHKAIDYICPWGTPIYASASGYATAGYHRYPALNEDNTLKLYKQKPFSLGLGYFVQIYHPYKISRVKGGRITQYAQLSKFAKGIYAKTQKPLTIDLEAGIVKKNSERRKLKKSNTQLKKKILETKKIARRYKWTKKLYGFSYSDDIKKKYSYLYTPQELKLLHEKGSKYVKWVEQGEIIGYTGTSGLIHGRLRYWENRRRPNVRKFNSWDSRHLHFEEAKRDWQTGKKTNQRDPYGIYLSKEHYLNLRFDTLFKDLEKKFRM